MRPIRLRGKLAWLAAAVAAAVLATTAWLTVRLFRGHLLDVLVQDSSNQSDVLRIVLEEEMLEGDFTLLTRLLDDIGREPGIAWVGVMNAQGRVRLTSDPALLDQVFERSAPECRACHEEGGAADRSRSVTLLRPEGNVLRTVTPLLNRPACHRCHGTTARMNGILVVDRSLQPLEHTVLTSRNQVLAGGVVLVVAVLVSLGLAVERLVLARLRRLRLAARELGTGNLAARAVDPSGDELGDLARDFNSMAAALASALAGVRAERRQLEELVNGISDGIALADVGLKLVASNRAFDARLPPSVRPEPGASFRALASAAGFASADGCACVAERALATNRLEKEIVRVPRPDGERTEEIYAQPLRGADGRVTAVIEVWRDITDRMALEASLEQSERLAAIGVLASSVAHEVGNPLAAIATAVEGLLRRGPGELDTAETKEYLEIVGKQVFRCREVTERLLGFARLPSRELGRVDAAEAAREVVALVAPQARAQGVEVRSALKAPAPAIAEGLLLQQVFLNLVLNALQAMPKGGVLAVEARTVDDAVLVTVADTGPGIPESVRRHLFQPFGTGRADGRGTGLGLFLSDALVKKCEGGISVESEPGRGATFTVRLRRAAAGPAEHPARLHA